MLGSEQQEEGVVQTMWPMLISNMATASSHLTCPHRVPLHLPHRGRGVSPHPGLGDFQGRVIKDDRP